MTGCRGRVATGALVPAALLLGACVTEGKLPPDDASWTGKDAVATWTADDVLIEVPLYTGLGEFPVRGHVVNRRADPVLVAFAPHTTVAGAGDGRLGGRDLLPLDAGASYEVPGAVGRESGLLFFSLRPDGPWGDLPATGAGVTWTVTLTTPAGRTECPFRFRVESVGSRASHGLRLGIGLVVVAAAIWVIAEHGGSDANSSF